MARNRELIEKRNEAIRERYQQLRRGKCVHWRTEPIYELLSEEFFLSVRRIEAILTCR